MTDQQIKEYNKILSHYNQEIQSYSGGYRIINTRTGLIVNAGYCQRIIDIIISYHEENI